MLVYNIYLQPGNVDTVAVDRIDNYQFYFAYVRSFGTKLIAHVF